LAQLLEPGELPGPPGKRGSSPTSKSKNERVLTAPFGYYAGQLNAQLGSLQDMLDSLSSIDLLGAVSGGASGTVLSRVTGFLSNLFRQLHLKLSHCSEGLRDPEHRSALLMAGALAEVGIGAVRPVLVLASFAAPYVDVLVARGSPVRRSPNFERFGYESPLGEIRRWVKTGYPVPP
jgi:hypothetical protein